jgi:hypothetical protein
MPRLAVLIVAPAVLVVACETAGPVEPSQVAPTSVSAQVRNDNTAPVAPADAASGGIMIGSGT